jgi:hypothetical protein
MNAAVYIGRGSGPLVLIAISGRLLSIPRDIIRQQWIRVTRAAKIIGGLPRIAPGELGFLKGLIEAGELRTVIDRRYSLDDIAEAFRYAEAGHKKGPTPSSMSCQPSSCAALPLVELRALALPPADHPYQRRDRTAAGAGQGASPRCRRLSLP